MTYCVPGPVVGVVFDAGILVGLDLIAFHDPFNGASAIAHIIISQQGDMAWLNLVVEDYPALVPVALSAAKFHLLDNEIAIFRALDLHLGARRRVFLTEVLGRQLAASFRKLDEILHAFRNGYFRQGFLEVIDPTPSTIPVIS